MITTLSLSCGCGDLIPPRPIIRQSAEPSSEEALSSEEKLAAGGRSGTDDARGAERFQGDWRESYVHRFGSQVVGVTEVQATAVIDPSLVTSGPSQVRFRRQERLVFRSGRTSFLRRILATSIETMDGSMSRFETEIRTGPLGSTIQGTRNGAELAIVAVRDGIEKKMQLAWTSETRGGFALEQTLRRRPIEKGETRRIPVLMPSMDSIGQMELRCSGDASVPMLDGSYRVLREVEVSTIDDSRRIDSLVVWIDENGVIEKMLRPDLRLETFRVDPAMAMTRFGPRDESEVVVVVAGTLRDDAEPIQVAFEVAGAGAGQTDSGSEGALRAASESGAGAVPPVACQAVRPIEGGLQVLVSSNSHPLVGFQQDRSTPRSVDLEPTALIDIADNAVTRVAASVRDLTGRPLAVEIARGLQRSLALTPQGELRPASLILRSGKGGGVDHAVVLAALLRSREISARVVFGLARDADGPAESDDRTPMALAAWVVAYADGRWFSIDPLTARVDRPDQLCLSHPAGDADLKAELSRVFRRVADIEIEIRGARYE
jgi:hypothetical protein